MQQQHGDLTLQDVEDDLDLASMPLSVPHSPHAHTVVSHQSQAAVLHLTQQVARTEVSLRSFMRWTLHNHTQQVWQYQAAKPIDGALVAHQNRMLKTFLFELLLNLLRD